MASRRGYSTFIIAASLLMLSGLSVLYLGTDGSDGINEGFTWERNGDDVTVTGHGTLGYDSSWSGLKTLTLVPEGGTIDIESHAFEDCNSLTTVTIDGSVGSIGENAFIGCGNLSELTVTGPITPPVPDFEFSSCINLKTVTVSCVMDIEAGSSDYGGIAEHATTVNKLHSYSSSYEWAGDGSSCTVHIVCANTSDHDHDVTDATITSTVKVPPTETEKGTTEYTVSGSLICFTR